MGYQLRMSGEIHDWLEHLRTAVAVLGQATGDR